MNRNALTAVFALALATASASVIPSAFACGDMEVCMVADPDGPALTVHTAAGAGVVTTLDNGVEVEVIEYQAVEGKDWVLISLAAPSWGYVVKDQLACNEADDYSEICTVDAKKGALEVLDNVDGALYGTLENGVRVRPYDTIAVDGVTWVAIERFSTDNALGWVLNASLTCGQHEDDL
jgi:hypothetical protein